MNSTEDLVPIPMIYSTLIMSIIGLVGNVTIILVTIFTRSLHHRCTVLIAILAAFDTIICVYLIQLRIMMFLRLYRLTSTTCFLSSVHGLFALNMQSSLGLLIGLDRLYSVSLPIKYSRASSFIYILLFCICLLFAISITAFGWIEASDETQIPVCLPPTAFHNRSRIIWISSNFLIALLVIIVYGASHFRCQFLRMTNRHSSTVCLITRLLRSLTVIIGVYVSTWFVTILMLAATQIFPLSSYMISKINEQLGWLVIINASCNVFIYFWRTPEYRRAILRLYRFKRMSSGEPSSVLMARFAI